MIVQLCLGRDGRPRIARRLPLFDRDRRRKPGYVVDVGLVHPLEELASIGTEALDITPLAFRVDGIESERGFPGSRRPAEDDQASSREVEIDVLQVVLASPADAEPAVRRKRFRF